MTIGLVAIVRDEAPRIARWLASVRPVIDSWTVVDTGSVDGTPELLEAGLAGVPGSLTRQPWHGFGASRSEALRRARGTADWLLDLDVDQSVTIAPDFAGDPAVDAYLVEAGDAAISYRLPKLLRGDLDWRSIGSTHEYTALADGTLGRLEATDAIRIVHHADGASRAVKWERDRELLEAALAADPDDARATFYLAQTYRETGDARARAMYERRAAMGGWDEEVFYSRFRAAELIEDWPDRMAALLAAWDSRPHRLEPLHAVIAELNRRGQHRLALALADAAPPATEDILFVHRWIWDRGLAWEATLAATLLRTVA